MRANVASPRPWRTCTTTWHMAWCQSPNAQRRGCKLRTDVRACRRGCRHSGCGQWVGAAVGWEVAWVWCRRRVRAEAEPVHGSRQQSTTTSCSGLHRCRPPYAVGVGLHGVPAVAPMLMEVDGRWWVTWREGKWCKPTPVAHMHHHMAHGMMPIPQCTAARLQAAHRCPCASTVCLQWRQC